MMVCLGMNGGLKCFNMIVFLLLGRVIKAAMSIFSGPMIEQSFSGINDLLTPKKSYVD